MKKFILLAIILLVSTQLAFSYSKEMTSLQNNWYSNSNTNDTKNLYTAMDKTINSGTSKIEKQTYKNIVVIMKANMHIDSKREIHSMLKNTLAENEPLLSESNADYMTSVADLMSTLIGYSTLKDVIKLSGKSRELYEKSLKTEPNNFKTLLGSALFTAFTPKMYGGGIDKAMPILQKAEKNAKENWQKHAVYIWLSQAYMKIGDKNNYKKYMTLAEKIFPDGNFFNRVKSMNDENKYMFGK